MNRVFKVENADGDIQEVYEDKLDLAAKDGYFPRVTDGTQTFTTSYNKLDEAKKDGFVPSKPVDDFLEQNKGLAGTLKVGAGQFIDEALFGAPEIIVENTESPEEAAKRKAIKKAHKVANVAGGIGGFAASTLIGSPLLKAASIPAQAAGRAAAQQTGKVVASQLAKKIAQKGTELAVEGALYSTPTALAEAVSGNPKAAVERIVAGGLGNAVVGGIIAGVPQIISNTTNKLTKKLDDISDVRAAKFAGLERGTAKKLGPEKVKELGRQLKEKGQVKLNASADDLLVSNQMIKNEVLQERKRLYDLIDDNAASQFKPLDVAAKLDKELGTFNKTSPLNKGAANQLDNTIEAILQRAPKEGDTITMQEAQKLVSELGNAAKFDTSRSSEANNLAKRAYGIVRNEINEAADRSGELLNQPKLKKTLNELNKTYANAKALDKLISNKLARESGNKMFGLTDTIAGSIAVGQLGPSGLAVLAGKKGLEKYGNQGASLLTARASQLLKNLQNSESLVSKMPSILQQMYKGVKIPSAAKIGGLTTSNLERMSSQLAQVEQNPEDFIAYVAPDVDILSNIDPSSGALLTTKLQEVASYIRNAIPKNPNPINTPFRTVPWTPSPMELAKFNRIQKAALDPQTVIQDLAQGILSRDSVKTVKDLYPEYSVQIDEKIMEFLEKNPNLSYKQKQQIQMLLQADYLPEYSAKSIQNLQKTFKSAEEEPQQVQTPKVKEIKVPQMNTSIDSALYVNKTK
ncbi:MAG: hypothetical protein KDB74_01440 [Flavobacteriales bacterium]|nr:hypothetical protein [Flavobacteriales bacterium]